MSRIDPLQLDQLSDDLVERMKQAEALMGFTPNDALIMVKVPGLMESMSGVVRTIYVDGAVSMELKRLVGMIGSSAAGCQYCTAHTGHGAHLAGVDAAKIEAIWDFRTSPLFSAAERAALEVAVAASQVPNGVTDEQFETLRAHYSEEAVLEIVAVIALFGFLNRWNHTLATELESSPLRFSQDHLSAENWDVGVHGSPD